MIKEAITRTSCDYIYYLTSEETKNWQKLLEFGKTLNFEEQRKFAWIWPSEENLKQLQNAFKRHQIDCVLSVGCGNGLLEWLLHESIGLQIYGLEVDRSWWQSKYALKSFIKLNFIEDINGTNTQTFLQECCAVSANCQFALFFCYFNNREAFLRYLEMYNGNWLIIIGPKPEVGIHTDPNPLEPNFPVEKNWQLCEQFSIYDVNNVVAFYTKIKK